MSRFIALAALAAGIVVHTAVASVAFAQAPVAFPQGRTVQAEARRIAALVAGAPVDVKPAAVELMKVVDAQVKQIGTTLAGLSMRFQVATRNALAEVQRTLAPAVIMQKLATPGDTNGDALGAHVEASVNAAVAHAQQALTAARDEATKFATEVENAIATPKSQAEALAQRGQPVVDSAMAFIAAAKRQAARLLQAARAQAAAVIGQISAAGKQALAAAAGPQKAFVARVRGAAQKAQAGIAQVASRLPAGPGRDLATQLQDKANETGRTFAQAIRAARQQLRDALAAAIGEASKGADPAPLEALVKEKGVQASPELDQKIVEVVNAAATSTKQAVAALREAMRQALDAAWGVLSPLEAEIKKLGPAGGPLLQQLNALVVSYRQEGARTVLRGLASARDAVQRASRAIRSAVAKATGGEAPPSTGRRVVLGYLMKLTEMLPAAQRELAQQAVAFAQKASRDARDISRRAIRAAKALVARATFEAQNAVASLRSVATDPKQAASTLKSRVETLVRNLTQGYLAPVKDARAQAKTIVASAEAAFQRFVGLLKPLGQIGMPLLAQARRLSNATRREAALMLRSVRSFAKTASRTASALVHKGVAGIAGVSVAPSSLRRLLEAYQTALKTTPPQLRTEALRVEAILSKERNESKARRAASSTALRTARRAAKQAALRALGDLVKQMKSPAAKQRPALIAEGATKIMTNVRTTILAVINDLKKNTQARGAALKRQAAEVERSLRALGPAGATLASFARQLFDELRTRAARNVLLAQERGKDAIRKIVNLARQRLASASPGSVKKRRESRRRMRELAKHARNAPPNIRSAIKKELAQAQALTKAMNDAIRAAIKETDGALKAARVELGFEAPSSKHAKGTKTAKGTKGARTAMKAAAKPTATKPAAPPTPEKYKAALRALAERTRKVVATAKAAAAKIVADTEALAQASEALAEKDPHPSIKKIAATMKGLVRTLKRDAARLLVTAKTRAATAIDRLAAMAKRRGPAKAAPATKGAPTKAAPAAIPKKAGLDLGHERVVAEVVR